MRERGLFAILPHTYWWYSKSHLFLLLVWWLLCSSFAISLVTMRTLLYISSPLVCLLRPTLLSSSISIILTLSYASKPCSSYLALSSLWEIVFFFSDSIEFFLCPCPHQMTDLLPLLMSPSNDGSSLLFSSPFQIRDQNIAKHCPVSLAEDIFIKSKYLCQSSLKSKRYSWLQQSH